MGFRPIIVPKQNLQGLQHIQGFGERYDLAKTQDQAIQNLYNRINYNANWDENGKRKFVVYPTEVITKNRVGSVIKKYRELVSSGTIQPINDIKSTAVFNTIVARVSDYSSVNGNDVSFVLKELFYAVRTSKDVSEEILSPGFRKNPTPEQAASFRLEQQKQELIAKQEEQENEQNNCGFFCKITNSISDAVGAGATFTKVIAVGVPTVVIGAAGTLIYIIARKALSFDVNSAFKEQQATSRVGARAAGKAAEGYLKSRY